MKIIQFVKGCDMRNQRTLLCAMCLISLMVVSLMLSACGGAPPKVYAVGVVNYVPALEGVLAGFKEGMKQQGYEEGKNVTYIYNGVTPPNPQALDAEVKKMMDQKVDLLLTMGTLPTLSAKKAVAGTTVPVVFVPVINPVEEAIISDPNRPGGNITGVQNGNTIPKALDWLHRLAPDATQVHVIYNSKDQVALTSLTALTPAALELGLELVADEVPDRVAAAEVVKALPKNAALFAVPSPSLDPLDDMVQLASQRGIPVGSTNHSQLRVGSLVTYGADFPAMGMQASELASKIFKGAKPGDLPIMTAEYFLNVNLQSAKASGIEIPQNILQQANIVVQ